MTKQEKLILDLIKDNQRQSNQLNSIVTDMRDIVKDHGKEIDHITNTYITHLATIVESRKAIIEENSRLQKENAELIKQNSFLLQMHQAALEKFFILERGSAQGGNNTNVNVK